jgi:hypothetical protein
VIESPSGVDGPEPAVTSMLLESGCEIGRATTA